MSNTKSNKRKQTDMDRIVDNIKNRIAEFSLSLSSSVLEPHHLNEAPALVKIFIRGSGSGSGPHPQLYSKIAFLRHKS
jgi:hypothetical protein